MAKSLLATIRQLRSLVERAKIRHDFADNKVEKARTEYGKNNGGVKTRQWGRDTYELPDGVKSFYETPEYKILKARRDETSHTHDKLYSALHSIEPKNIGPDASEWLKRCKKFNGKGCMDAWRAYKIDDYLPRLEQQIRMDPMSYTDSDSKLIRSFANKLIQGE